MAWRIVVTGSRTDGDKRAATKDAVEAWFVDRGVPRFVEEYSIRRRLTVLVAPLSVVAAAQIAAAALLSLKTWQVALAPAVVVALAAPILPVVRAGLDPRPTGRKDRTIGWPRAVLRLLPLAILAVGVAFWVPADKPQWELCVDGVVMLSALLAAGMLLREEIWICDKPSMPRMRVGLFAWVVLAVVVFALEGSPVDGFQTQTLGTLPPSAPQALPVLPILLFAWALALALSRGAAEPSDDTLDGVARSRNILGLSPMLVVVLGFETAVLPGTLPAPWAATVPVVALCVLFAWSLRRSAGQPPDWTAKQIKRSTSRLRQLGRSRLSQLGLSRDGVLWLVILAYALAYPIVAEISGQESFLVSLGINVAYLIIASFVVFYGLDRVAVWAIDKLRTDKKDLLLGLVRGLPLLLVFSALFIMTTELWQAAVDMEDLEYLALLGALVGLIAVFLLISAEREFNRNCRFRGWADVNRAARRVKPFDDDIDDLEDRLRRVLAEAGVVERHTRETPPDTHEKLDQTVRDLLDEAALLDDAGEATREDEPDLKLSRSQKVNGLAVVLVYQALIFVPVFIAVFVVFWFVGRNTVSDDLLKNWIYGDSAVPEAYPSFHDQSWYSEPWTRMAGFLAVFSLLYFAVSVLSNEQLRKEFFAAADEGIRQRLAMRLIYAVQLGAWGLDAPEDSRSKTRVLMDRARTRAATRALRSPVPSAEPRDARPTRRSRRPR
jgi:hypothetical protein